MRKVPRVIVNCANCGAKLERFPKEVEKNKGGNFFCSQECKHQWYQTIVHCASCGAELKRSREKLQSNKSGNFFCNQECKRQWQLKNWQGENSPAYKGKPPQEFTCDQCGQKFSKRLSHLKNNKNIFCSKKCKIDWQREHPSKQPRKRVVVRCERCGKMFEARPSERRKFCSRECAAAWKADYLSGELSPLWKRVNIPCANCGKILARHPVRVNNSEHQFCDGKCRGEWLSKTQRGENHPMWNGGKIIVYCATCGKPIERIRSEVENRSERFFCGLECRGKWQSLNMVGENHPNWKDNHLKTECAYCGNPLDIEGWRAKRGKHFFCNYECMGKWQAQNLTGEKCWNWKGGGHLYYGPNWGIQRDATRKRDNYHCQYCGISQKKHGQKLHVHHIKPFREFGYIAGKNENYLQANDLRNLITLCAHCHRKAEYGLIAIQPVLL